ncbi:MAG: HEAT repeat domain-containing protein, partial [Planctomycetota bacterium]
EPAIPQLVAALADEDVLVCDAVARTLGRIGSPRALAALEDLLERGTAKEQRYAAVAALEMGPEALPLLGALLPLSGRVSDTLIYESARKAIKGMGVAAVPALIGFVEGDDLEASRTAAYALRDLGPAAAPAVPSLIEAMSRHPRERLQAFVFAFAHIGVPAVAGLSAALSHESETVRLGAARALGEIGRPASDAVPALERAAAGDADPGVREAAAASLRQVKPPEGSSLQELLDRLTDRDLFVRSRARLALKKLGVAVIPDLIRALDKPRYREPVIEILGEFGPAAREAVPAIARLVGDQDLRYSVMRALDSIGVGVVPALIEVLGHESFRTRLAAARELGNMGEKAKEAIPALETAAKDEEEMVRKAAVRALEQIRGK